MNWDVGPDGRFLLIKQGVATGEPAANDIVLVQNFDQELQRLFPDQ